MNELPFDGSPSLESHELPFDGSPSLESCVARLVNMRGLSAHGLEFINDLNQVIDAAAKYGALHTPEIEHFIAAVEREALFQREKWGASGDAGKADSDWFWLIGFLAGKAIRPATAPEKQLHHIITTAAACLNWHAARMGTYRTMRPGIDEAA